MLILLIFKLYHLKRIMIARFPHGHKNIFHQPRQLMANIQIHYLIINKLSFHQKYLLNIFNRIHQKI